MTVITTIILKNRSWNTDLILSWEYQILTKTYILCFRNMRKARNNSQSAHIIILSILSTGVHFSDGFLDSTPSYRLSTWHILMVPFKLFNAWDIFSSSNVIAAVFKEKEIYLNTKWLENLWKRLPIFVWTVKSFYKVFLFLFW